MYPRSNTGSSPAQHPYLDDGAECTLSKFDDDTKLGGVTDTPEGHAAIQMDFNRLEKWAERKLTKFSKEKYQVLHITPCTSICWEGAL